MRFLSIVGNSFGCSASGERLVSAARDGDIQEAKALLEYNPRLARYSTFGVRNSPLHYSAAQGHHEIVSLLLESGVDINLRNYRGQTALMQACQHGHWEVVLTLILKKASIHKSDYLNGGTALHLAALNGHTRCIRLLLADYIPSDPNIFGLLREKKSRDNSSVHGFDESALSEVINASADGGVTALHMSALNGHVDTVHLLLDFGATVSNVTVEDGTTIDLIGAGSTPLHYAACGGNAQCCQLLIARGASLTVENANGWSPLMVARSWHRDWLEDILSQPPQSQLSAPIPSPYLCLPLMSIVNIARECGWKNDDSFSACLDPCAVCLERKCTIAAEGCLHEFCTSCALYLCSTNTLAQGPPGSISCPLCRHGIISFAKLPSTRPVTKEAARTSLSLPFCSCSSAQIHEPGGANNNNNTLETPLCKGGDYYCSSSFRSMSCQGLKLSPGLCLGGSEGGSRRRGSVDLSLRSRLVRCSRPSFGRSGSQGEGRSWLCSFNSHYFGDGNSC